MIPARFLRVLLLVVALCCVAPAGQAAAGVLRGTQLTDGGWAIWSVGRYVRVDAATGIGLPVHGAGGIYDGRRGTIVGPSMREPSCPRVGSSFTDAGVLLYLCKRGPRLIQPPTGRRIPFPPIASAPPRGWTRTWQDVGASYVEAVDRSGDDPLLSRTVFFSRRTGHLLGHDPRRSTGAAVRSGGCLVTVAGAGLRIRCPHRRAVTHTTDPPITGLMAVVPAGRHVVIETGPGPFGGFGPNSPGVLTAYPVPGAA